MLQNFNAEKFFAKTVFKENGCLVWHRKTNARYPKFSIGKKTAPAHRISYTLYHGEIPEGGCILHTCDNTQCCNPNHLYLGDQKQNALDRKNRGREGDRRGIKHGMCKLTEQDILDIRSYGPEIKHVTIAKQYNVTPEMISNIRRRLNWKHIGG